jgi:hypothetical protein
MKTDILQETLYFSYDKSSLAEIFPLKADEVRQVIDMNRHGQKPESLKRDEAPIAPEFVTSVGDDSISRFDETRKRHKNNHHNRPDRRPNGQDAQPQQGAQQQQNAQPQQNRQGGQPRQNRQNWQPRQNRQGGQPQQNSPAEKTPDSTVSQN